MLQIEPAKKSLQKKKNWRFLLTGGKSFSNAYLVNSFLAVTIGMDLTNVLAFTQTLIKFASRDCIVSIPILYYIAILTLIYCGKMVGGKIDRK